MKRFLVVPIMLLLGAAPAFAAPGQGQNLQNLGLSADAQAQVQATRAKYKDQLKPLFQDMRTTHQSMRAELQKPAPDDATLSQLTDHLQTDRQQMMAIRQQQNAEIRKELTPTQYAKLMMARARFFGRHMHGQRGQGGQPGGSDVQQ
ncbi:MAG TPA: periplasmic heavy metal sensor [Polyangia bacterium]|jgi:Spy/CpxP family protein refolding chaperone